MVVHHCPLGAEGEIGGDKACGTGELPLAPHYFPDDCPPLQVIQTAWPDDPLAYGGEGHFAKAPIGDGALLVKGALASHLNFGLKGSGLAVYRFDAGLHPLGRQHRSQGLAMGRGSGAERPIRSLGQAGTPPKL
jgi:hypothetical protein